MNAFHAPPCPTTVAIVSSQVFPPDVWEVYTTYLQATDVPVAALIISVVAQAPTTGALRSKVRRLPGAIQHLPTSSVEPLPSLTSPPQRQSAAPWPRDP